jgi:hypothetical protein
MPKQTGLPFPIAFPRQPGCLRETRGFPSPPRNGFGMNRGLYLFPLGLGTRSSLAHRKDSAFIGQEIVAAEKTAAGGKGP